MALTLCHLGCVARTSELLDYVDGQDSAVDIYMTARDVVRVRRGLLACAHLSTDELDALRVGGPLDCVSALRAAGADLEPDGCLHVRFHAGGSRARPRFDRVGRDITAHWGRMRTPLPSVRQCRLAYQARREPLTRAHVPLREALRQALLCLPATDAIAVIAAVSDSILAAADVERVVAGAPRRTKQALARAGLVL